MSCGFFPALDKAGWREAPGWFEAVIPQPGSDSYKRFAPPPGLPLASDNIRTEFPQPLPVLGGQAQINPGPFAAGPV